MPLVIPAAGGSSSVAATEIPAPIERGQEGVAEENAYLELADPDEGTTMVRQSGEEVVTEQPKKIKKKRLIKQSNVLLAKKLRTNHPSLAPGTEGKTLAGLEQIMSAGSRLLAREQSAAPSVAPPSQENEGFVDFSAQASLQIRTTVGSSSTLSAPVDTAAATTTSTKAKLATDVNPDLAGATRQICLGSEVRSRAEHELELKEKLNAKYAARGKLLEEKKDTGDLSSSKVTLTLMDPWGHILALNPRVFSLRAGLGFQGDKIVISAEARRLMKPAGGPLMFDFGDARGFRGRSMCNGVAGRCSIFSESSFPLRILKLMRYKFYFPRLLISSSGINFPLFGSVGLPTLCWYNAFMPYVSEYWCLLHCLTCYSMGDGVSIGRVESSSYLSIASLIQASCDSSPRLLFAHFWTIPLLVAASRRQKHWPGS
ncbi:hypothetical protein Tco_0705513 [Tanacetum coccineum]|uniref:Uncharacterized protein n=1 Tax=Tanacetum coccineum TaxID=301880 RepID=A0ABQ4Y6V1_9ASTR